MNPVKVGLIGFGKNGVSTSTDAKKRQMGRGLHLRCLILRIAGTGAQAGSRCEGDRRRAVVFDDPEVQVVGLFALADSRKSADRKGFLPRA